MKTSVLNIVLFLIAIVVNGQTVPEPKTDFAKMYLPVWIEAKAHCLAVAEAMPEDKYNYTPNKESKTFAEQMVHIGYTIELLTKRYVQGMDVVPNSPDASTMTKAEIKTLLTRGFDYTIQVISTIEEEKLAETCTMYHSGNTVSRAFALFYVQDHVTNHRAKANLYVRMNGITPPAYTW